MLWVDRNLMAACVTTHWKVWRSCLIVSLINVTRDRPNAINFWRPIWKFIACPYSWMRLYWRRKIRKELIVEIQDVCAITVLIDSKTGATLPQSLGLYSPDNIKEEALLWRPFLPIWSSLEIIGGTMSCTNSPFIYLNGKRCGIYWLILKNQLNPWIINLILSLKIC